MPTSEITNWVESASAIVDENDDKPTDPWRKEHILNHWADALEYAQKKILTSSTKIRQEFLQKQLLPLVKQQGKS
jgi:hypothetical protein